jgi:hypothetical protein
MEDLTMQHAQLPDAGRTGHQLIDLLLPTAEQKHFLEGRAVPDFAAGLRTRALTDTVSNPPTDSELDAAFGAPATVGAGYLALLLDGAGHAWLVASDGANWWHAALTLAV